MLLSSLDIHGLNVQRMTQVFFGLGLYIAQWQSAGFEISRLLVRTPVRATVYHNHINHASVLFSGNKHLLEICFSGFKFLRDFWQSRISRTLISMNSFVWQGISGRSKFNRKERQTDKQQQFLETHQFHTAKNNIILCVS